MIEESLEKAVALAGKVGNIIVATADHRGVPHVAVAARMKLSPGSRDIEV